MKVLVKVPEDIAKIVDRNELAKELFDYVVSLYDETVNDKEVYLVDNFEYTLGSDCKEAILCAARKWNDEIIDTFTDACKGLLEEMKAAGELKIDTLNTYRLYKASCELDGRFCEYGEHAVNFGLDSQGWYLKASITDGELAEIEANPSDFAILAVYEK